MHYIVDKVRAAENCGVCVAGRCRGGDWRQRHSNERTPLAKFIRAVASSHMQFSRLRVVALVLCAATCASAVCPFASFSNPSPRSTGVGTSAARPPPLRWHRPATHTPQFSAARADFMTSTVPHISVLAQYRFAVLYPQAARPQDKMAAFCCPCVPRDGIVFNLKDP